MLNDPLPFATAVPMESPQMNDKKEGAPILNERLVVDQLMQQGFTRGLALSMTKNNQAFPSRIWVIDNSGSMRTADGHRMIETTSSKSVKIVDSSRWEEICETVSYHIRAADLLQAPTCFRLLNNPGAQVGPQKFVVGTSSTIHFPKTKVLSASDAIRLMRDADPCGCTPLTAHVHEIHQQVLTMVPSLKKTGSKCVIVIATDGLPTDEVGQSGAYQQEMFVKALKLLEGLPVWLVIRLCTDEDEVGDFYNSLDDQLELSIDVLDDVCAEAVEVNEHNRWLNYGLPIHRCREMGFYNRVFDIIDERALTKSELREFLQILLGDLDGIPDPSVDWRGFYKGIHDLLRREELTWNPATKMMAPWINMGALQFQYGDGGCCTIL